jgi:hypothetical protein
MSVNPSRECLSGHVPFTAVRPLTETATQPSLATALWRMRSTLARLVVGTSPATQAEGPALR